MELACLACGIAPGRLLRGRVRPARYTGRLIQFSIFALLFALGAKLGGNEALFASLRELGLRSLVISLCCTMGSVLAMLPIRRFFPNLNAGQGGTSAGSCGLQAYLGSLYILACFCLGMLLARLDLLPAWMLEEKLFMILLWVMLFCIGMGMGFDLGSLLLVRDLGLRALLLPALSVTGTALGAIPAFLLLPGVELRETLTVGAGLGYYSLSSVIISNSGHVALGSTALIANICRELFALLACRPLARIFGPLAPVAAAGAPAMDTCLAAIVSASGERCGILAVFNGIALTILVPLLVPLALLLFKPL